MISALILDLDNTIFETRSMDAKIFTPFFEDLTIRLTSHFDEATIVKISEDLWKHTWDRMIEQYRIPVELILASTNVFSQLDPGVSFSTYPDYEIIKHLTLPKFLVTTSVTTLQEFKIKALNIEKDFQKILINDTFKDARTKVDFFKELVEELSWTRREPA